ncbi:MAG: cation:proton antiporter [Chthoniobacterales bacterium]
MNYLPLTHDDPIVMHLAELALFSVLLHGWHARRDRGRREGVGASRARAAPRDAASLATALFAYFLADIAWIEALLLGAILCPTDPIFAVAIVGKKRFPAD